jgi:hypothetical protein
MSRSLEQLKYPIGQFTTPSSIDASTIEQWITDIATFPHSMKALTNGLTTEQLNWGYRPGGWTIKQLVHHCADSHINSLIRFKLSLTEDQPIIRPYFEDRWAQLPDSLDDDIAGSLLLLEGLHARWVKLLHSMNREQMDRTFYHPESKQTFTLKETIGNYAWHGNHHLAHVQQALASGGVFNY